MKKLSARKYFPRWLLFWVLAFATALGNVYPLSSFAQTGDEPYGKSELPQCGVPMSAAGRGPIWPDPRYLLYDDFDLGRSTLGPEYEIRDGPGFLDFSSERISIPGGGVPLRYYALPRGVEFSTETEHIKLDCLGRPWAPSLLIARSFRGKTWTFDTKILYGFQQSSNGRAIHIWITFGDIAERSKNAVKITRYNDNPGKPHDRGTLTVNIFEGAKQVISKPVQLNEYDSYFFCIKRNGCNIEVLVSVDEISYSPILMHTFGPEIDQRVQWLIINGSAFAPGAYADIEFLSVRAPAQEAVAPLPSKRALFQRYGSPSQLINVDAEEIKTALKEGKNIDIRYAKVTGVLNLTEVKKSAFENRMVFKFCYFANVLSGGNITFDGDVSFVNCQFWAPLNFSGAKFKGKVDFSGSTFHGDTRFILAEFTRGADFSGATFIRKTFFRIARFNQPTSFYYSNFEEGADFSSTVFEKDVSFSDFSFSKPETVATLKPDMTFFGSTFNGKAIFISSLQRSVAPLGEEVSFQQSNIKHLIFSSGDPNPFVIATEQTGKGLWVIRSNVSLLDAKVETLTFKNVSFQGVTDLRGVTFGSSKDSVRLLNVDFTDLKLDSWPVGKVLATPETRGRLVSVFDEANNTVASRTAFFDLLAVSKYYEKWLRDKREDRHPNSYRDYLGYWVRALFLRPFWVMSGYGTSLVRTFLTGFALTLLFALLFLFFGKGRGHLIRIEKPMELKTRLSETPLLSFGEKVIQVEEVPKLAAVSRWGRILAAIQSYLKSAQLHFLFSLNTVAKIGFGNIRVRMEKGSPKRLVGLAWAAWVVGYAWYILLIYTLSVIPVLAGLF